MATVCIICILFIKLHFGIMGLLFDKITFWSSYKLGWNRFGIWVFLFFVQYYFRFMSQDIRPYLLILCIVFNNCLMYPYFMYCMLIFNWRLLSIINTLSSSYHDLTISINCYILELNPLYLFQYFIYLSLHLTCLMASSKV